MAEREAQAGSAERKGPGKESKRRMEGNMEGSMVYIIHMTVHH
jgi:hypothetical protein